MKIGLIGAMPQEIKLIRAALVGPSDRTFGNRVYHSGKLHGRDAVVAFSRWGKVAAATTATTLIQQFGVDLVIFTGVAGAVAEDLHVGDVVVAARLVQHDFDASSIVDEAEKAVFQKFEIPLLGISYFSVQPELVAHSQRSAEHYINEVLHTEISQELRAEFCQVQPKVKVGVIASGDQFIASSSKLTELRESIPNLQCVEMEGAAVAQVCYEHSVPFIVVRAISDKADHSAPVDFVRFVQHIASRYSYGIVRHLLETVLPRELPAQAETLSA